MVPGNFATQVNCPNKGDYKMLKRLSAYLFKCKKGFKVDFKGIYAI